MIYKFLNRLTYRTYKFFNKFTCMNEDNKFYLEIALFISPFIFSLIDFTSCLVNHGIIFWWNCYSFRIFLVLIPISLIATVIAKLIWRERTFNDIFKYAFIPLFIWFIEMGFALFFSLFIGVFIDMMIGANGMIFN